MSSANHGAPSAGASATQRPFKVLGVQQIAIGGPDKGRLQKLWVDMFGLEVTGTFKSERENVDEAICAIGSGPFKVEVDLMQPLDPEKKNQRSTPRPSITSACGSITCLWRWNGSPHKACVLPPVAFAKGRRVLTSPFCIPKATMSFPSAVKAC